MAMGSNFSGASLISHRGDHRPGPGTYRSKAKAFSDLTERTMYFDGGTLSRS